MNRHVCRNFKILAFFLLVSVNSTTNGYQNGSLSQPVINQPRGNSMLFNSGINVGQPGIAPSNYPLLIGSANNINNTMYPTDNMNNPVYSRWQVPTIQFSENQLTNDQNKTPNTNKRTCLTALQESIDNGIYDNYCVLDLSNTIDFIQSADFVTERFFSQVQLTNVKYVYMDLYNSSVTDVYISKWATIFRQSGVQVLWNLSGNKSVSDQTIAMLGSLDNVIGLNISGTSVTDLGATQLATMLSSANPVCIDFINIYKSQISEQGFKMLEMKFIENSTKWNVANPNKNLSRRGIINDLSIKKLTSAGNGRSKLVNQEQSLLNQPLANSALPLLNNNLLTNNPNNTATVSSPVNSNGVNINSGLNVANNYNATGYNTANAGYTTQNVSTPASINGRNIGTSFNNLATTGLTSTNLSQTNRGDAATGTTETNNWNAFIARNTTGASGNNNLALNQMTNRQRFPLVVQPSFSASSY